ncbi:MAG TPA: Nif3-like dinuclear metal center hexameric protein [Candidatus Latescibacteria bacterium]|jgi:putative NIF3 family GTP cyclohydrolase 1 type 2|nr:Nif3-like dinuclear metal center hexameric protein [Candidatus Latescibacterota bacterium]HJP32660.1 Nif3-like dinuclear metal center hexameric protein [Candidatus Latescibacterota bacterium]
MNTNDLLEHMIAHSPWVDPKTTVDTLKAGDGERPIHKVGVCWYPGLTNIRTAIEMGCQLLVTHEPTWWDHFDRPGGWREGGPGLEKTQLLAESGMAVARLHDTWDNWPEIGIRDSLAGGLGFTRFVGEDETRWHATYEVDPMPLRDFARRVAGKVAPLGEDAVQVIGDPHMVVCRPSIGVGCGGPAEDMIELGSDVLIVCFDGASYWSERERFAEQGVGVITLEHGTTEMWGIESLARYIGDTWPDLGVHYLDGHWRAWHVVA